MGTLRSAQLIVALGVILAGVGAQFLVWAFVPAQVNESFTIPQGQGFHVYYAIWTVGEGLVRGSFTTQGLEIYLRVFTADEYARYRDTGQGSYLYANLATEGQFSVDLPVTGGYYVVLSHHPDFIPEQTGMISMTVTGIHAIPLGLGIGLAVAGAVVTFIGRRKTKRARLAGPAVPASLGGEVQTGIAPPR